MLDTTVVVAVSLAYLGLLFAIAFYGDRRARAGRSLVRSPITYALSLGVYCTSWTYYGAVGTAARDGLIFLTIYTGPTIVFMGWWFILRKIARISKAHRITSIADFIASRYGKSASLGMIVTLIAVVGTMPYIALQLKAVATSFAVLISYYGSTGGTGILPDIPPAVISGAALITAMGMAAFAILFGTRHIDASEHHEGVVAAIAFESCVKLAALLAVGIFALFFLSPDTGDPGVLNTGALRSLYVLPADYEARWLTMTFLSMAAIICLPRQFHIAIVENVEERHLTTAAWLFPLYLLLMCLFALPIAAAGLTTLSPDSNSDFFVLTVPIVQGQDALAIFAFIGGLSAATSMVIVSAIALSTMLCNDLVMPCLLRIPRLRLTARGDLTRLLLFIRRAGIVVVLLLGYAYYRLTGGVGPLAQIGLVAFAAVAQFVPVMLGALFWKGGTKAGAQVGLTLGFVTWFYTLIVPALAGSTWLPSSVVTDGPWGLAFLRPEALFGLEGWEPLSHAVFWSMAANGLGYILVSLFSRQDVLDRMQATLFVDVFRRPRDEPHVWRRSAAVDDLYTLLQRFLGRERAQRAFQQYAEERGRRPRDLPEADADLVAFVERLLAGSVGAASARVIVSSIAKGELLVLDEVLEILEATREAIVYSRRLEEKSLELEATANELRRANEQLKELDRLKDDFLTTISHELRTPLTSIRSFSEILSDPDELDAVHARQFLEIISSESRRLTRLLDSILDIARLEQGHADWRMADIDPAATLSAAVAATGGLFRDKNVAIDIRVEFAPSPIHADRDRLIQVFVNLLSNAAKFCDPASGRVRVEGRPRDNGYLVAITDNGGGVSPRHQARIFEKFAKADQHGAGPHSGFGLGLAISRQIVEHHRGALWLRSPTGQGATFCVFLPAAASRPAEAERAAASA
ncbi:sensor histidine kinase [Inquilinus sp. CAU 1745]|uniref:sensor histidine kinase n=1 Tax=Inquilinus sp. CAU 1745 TaxID=3140369 RepID=UPI00325ACCB1